ncbi:uncharacterized protein LOC116196947 isoform X1 [Punica granatum]|uniref:Uncharacterized protein LOC116196947 isoform X1 n=1 Tax=Punica granatum TaxID=22663 RepID=A0A6P8CN53_PUNGR|nr:uncharacterized protein LOC116196947 isoform X1 [Punica granatum]
MSQQQEQSPSLDDCLKLLKGERDEQRLAGLLLLTKFCRGDDHASIRRAYDAVGSQFLDRLLRTGMRKGPNGGSDNDNRDAYLQLSVTVLATLCRVPEIASSKEMVSKIPVVLEVMSKESVSPVLEECYEFLYLTSSTNEDGVTTLFESDGIRILASPISTFTDGSHLMELSMKLVQLMLSKVSLGIITDACLVEMSTIVAAIIRQFAMLHNALKFDALHLLSAIFSSDYSGPLKEELGRKTNNHWPDYLLIGVVAILQNRVAPAEKLHSLVLAETAISIMGERWLINPVKLPNMQEQVPPDRCLLLVLESSRVEVAVLLNDIAYLKYEASKNTSSTMESILSKRRHLGIAFSLVEKIIRLISTIGEEEGSLVDDNTFVKVINGLNETIAVVLEYLQDAKDHGQKKGDDLLASVRVVGSYLAETPMACKEKVRELLAYMLSVEGEDEPSPFSSVCFLMPLLCQITMDFEGCKSLVSSGGHRAIVQCLVKLVGQNALTDSSGGIFLACDTVLNLLIKREELQLSMDASLYIDLLKALTYWAENACDLSVTMMASSVCSLILDYTSEEALLKSELDRATCNRLYCLVARSLTSVRQALLSQDVSDDAQSEMDLYEIISSGYSRWAPRFPSIKSMVERS